jgi:hypothetical protein
LTAACKAAESQLMRYLRLIADEATKSTRRPIALVTLDPTAKVADALQVRDHVQLGFDTEASVVPAATAAV